MQRALTAIYAFCIVASMTPEAIKSFREKSDLSQAELAKQLGVDQATVSRAERGGSLARPVELLLRRLMADAEFEAPAETGVAA